MSAVASYHYVGPSVLNDDGLALRTSGGRAAALGPVSHPRFFRGFMVAPDQVAAGLLAVAEVARSRYFQRVDRIAALDPVVTGSRDRLRFESFSGCCGVYARLDVLPAGLDGETLEHGTTNVDVNTPLRDALAKVTRRDPLRLNVGAEDLVVSTVGNTVVEKKVPLPTRWLRGFAEIQALVSGFDARLEVNAAQAATFLRGLPTGRDRSVLWVVAAGQGLRLTSRPVPGAVCLPGPGRLVALRSLLRFATTLRVYGPPATAASPAVPSTWELESPTQRLTLTLSPQPSRGFPGEGATLDALVQDGVIEDADTVGALLAFDPSIDVADLAAAAGLSSIRVRAALTQLATAGWVGYDVTEAAFFHRVLPYDAAAAARLNPRLAAARHLVSGRAVTVADDHAWVHSADADYQVGLEAGAPVTCTCQWWGRHRGGRGPCKHVLAVAITVGSSSEVDA